MSFAGKWMELGIIMLSRIDQAQKTKHLMVMAMMIGHECKGGTVWQREPEKSGKEKALGEEHN
jgi:hypothetical protein